VSPIMSFTFDSLITILLIAAIVYMVLLNRRLARLRGVKEELEQVLAGFGEAAAKAESSIARLRSLSSGAQQLDKQDRERLDRALGLRDDLAFLLERGNQLADRLEADVRQARDGTSPGAMRSAEVTALAAVRGDAAPAARRAAPPSAAEQALIAALKQARS
jgi:uncharacterized phage infection (PIP) family protein YhgE